MSVPPPAPKGTIIVTGRVGQACADTPALASELESELEDAMEQASTGDAVAYVEPKALEIEVRETPSANDRALDTWSLFDGLSHDAPSRDGEASRR